MDNLVGRLPRNYQHLDIARLICEHRYQFIPPMFAKSGTKCGTKYGAAKGYHMPLTALKVRYAQPGRRYAGLYSSGSATRSPQYALSRSGDHLRTS